MKKIFILFSILLLTTQVSAQANIAATIGIPQNSGLAFVTYLIYEVHNTQLYVIKRSISPSALDADTTTARKDLFKYDTLERYPISKEQLQKLADPIEHTDSLGQHIANGCDFAMGWPRFFIHTMYKDKTMSGYVSNCYREHIYKIIDVFNDIYPKGDILTYNKTELIALEARCNSKVK